MANSPDKKAAIEFLQKYREAYAAVTGLRYKIPGDEVLKEYEELLKDKLFNERIKIRHQLDPEGFKKAFLIPFSKEDDFISYLADQIVFHNNLSDSRISNIPVGTLPTNDFNAAAIKTDIGDRVIVLNSGIVAFMSEVLNSFLGTISTPFSPPLWNIQEASFRIIQWSTAVATGIAKYGISQTPGFTDPYLMGASGLIGDTARVFILGHEYGHFIHGHLNDSNTKIRTLVPGSNPIEFYIKDHSQEFEADSKGFELCKEWCRKVNKGNYQIAFLAIIFVFHLLKLLEECRSASGDELTHPPADMRRKLFEERYFREFDEQIKFEISYLDYFMKEVYAYVERSKTIAG